MAKAVCHEDGDLDAVAEHLKSRFQVATLKGPEDAKPSSADLPKSS